MAGTCALAVLDRVGEVVKVGFCCCMIAVQDNRPAPASTAVTVHTLTQGHALKDSHGVPGISKGLSNGVLFVVSGTAGGLSCLAGCLCLPQPLLCLRSGKPQSLPVRLYQKLF